MTLLSTTAADDLTVHNNDLVRFSTTLPGLHEEAYLGYAHKWFIGSQSECSCEFRHLAGSSIELGFGEPEAWFPENPEAIAATQQVMATIRTLVERGERVDCIDAWAHDEHEAAPLTRDFDVSVSTVSNATFRFFENYRFNFVR